MYTSTTLPNGRVVDFILSKKEIPDPMTGSGFDLPLVKISRS